MDSAAWKPAVAFLIVALAAGFAIQRSSAADARLLHTGLIAACERQNENVIRENIRTRVMEEVLLAAADSREREAEAALTPEQREINLQVADQYRRLTASLPYAEPIECEEEVPNP